MTRKQAFFRLLKEFDLFIWPVIIKYTYVDNIYEYLVSYIRKKVMSGEEFPMYVHRLCLIAPASFFDSFTKLECKLPNCGDIITIKTSDGKYECDYFCSYVYGSKVYTNDKIIVDIERVEKVNGKKVNYNNIFTVNLDKINAYKSRA